MWVKEIFFTALLVWSLTCLIKDLLLYWQEYSCLLSKLYYRKSLINSTFKFVIHTSQMSILLHQCYVPLSPALPDPKVSSDACWQEEKMGELGSEASILPSSPTGIWWLCFLLLPTSRSAWHWFCSFLTYV